MNLSIPAAQGAEQLEKLRQGAQETLQTAQQPQQQRIDTAKIQDAIITLGRYKSGKANLEQNIIANEQWFKLRHWEYLRKGEANQVEPTSGWLFNSLQNKLADAMDNYPAPNIIGRESGDAEEAKRLSSIIPVVLDQAEFEETYEDVSDAKIKFGTGVYGVFWDAGKLNGLGDISIRQVDILNLFWEPGVKDVQASKNVFTTELVDNDVLIDRYPELQGKLNSSGVITSDYIHDDTIDTTNKSTVVDWYYKKFTGGRTVLHYCKFVGDTVLFATENQPEYQDTGWYAHGMYPFVFDAMFSMPGTPCGFGYIDVAKSAQEYIDRGNQAILQNLLANSRPRHFIRADGSVNEKEYADYTKDFIHVDGNLGQDSILPVQGKPLDGIYVNIITNKVDELKEVTGNRDISTGGTTSGVTAASAIAAMQEAGSKLSRLSNKASYRAFRKVVLLVIELIRQFYDLPRQFRIIGNAGAQEYITYTNAGLAPQPQGVEMGVDMGYRLPLFDVEISAEKQSPYSRMSQNELALQFYSAGFFNPQLYSQALACMDMMDFPKKDTIMQKIAQNGMLYQQAMMMVQPVQPESTATAEEPSGGESSITKNARQRVADSTDPG